MIQDSPTAKSATLLTLTPLAAQQARELANTNPDWSNRPLRVYLSGKGCSGFEYGVTFDAKEPDDHATQCGDIEVVIDPETRKFVQGAVVDWVDDERGRGFLVENPNHKKFRGKFFKREGWEQRLINSEHGQSANLER